MTWVVQPAWVGALYIPQVPGICPASGEQDRLWQHKVKSVGKTRLKWKGGKRSCVFLEFPEAPDTGSLFPLFSWATLHGQAGHALPPAEEQPSGEPFPTALSLCGRRAAFASTLSKCHDEAHRPPSTHMVHFLCEGFSHLPLLSSLQPSPTAMSLAPTPAPEHWLSWPQTLLLLMFSTPKTAYSFSPQPSPGPPGNAFPAIALRSSRPFLCGPQACLHLVDSALDFSHLWGWSSTTWWVLQVEGPCSRTDPAT